MERLITIGTGFRCHFIMKEKSVGAGESGVRIVKGQG